jgi:hypothetical protein
MHWHLNTRPNEFEKIEHPGVIVSVRQIGDLLNSCRYQTIIPGDDKVANFCFFNDGKNEAAVNFQHIVSLVYQIIQRVYSYFLFVTY